VTPEESADGGATSLPSATRNDLQLGRRLFHLGNGVATATAYGLFFTYEQIVRSFGVVACLIYIIDQVRIAYPETVSRYAPWVNHTFVRAEERARESAMIPYAIAVLLTIIAVPKFAALVAIGTLAVADPLAAVVGIRCGRWRLAHNRTLEGSAAFFLATTAIAFFVFRLGTAVAPSRLGWCAAAVGLVAAVFELLPLRMDDNLTIPLFTGFATWAIAALCGVPLG